MLLGDAVNALEATQLNAWKKLYDGTGGAAWSVCSDKKEDPCGCSRASCSGEDITGVELWFANLQGNTYMSSMTHSVIFHTHTNTLFQFSQFLYFFGFYCSCFVIFIILQRYVFLVEKSPIKREVAY